ncbi:MAG: hypothetical protein EHM41_10440 [Chloroflexi bacterium]|nr:MAG: hypothetical protein EHM41_10440 [Chloroflexota bacterium]
MNPSTQPKRLPSKSVPVLVVIFSFALIACVVLSVASGALLLANRAGDERANSSQDTNVSDSISEKDPEQVADIIVERPDEAVLQEPRGLVEVCIGDDQWDIARPGEPLFSGAHIRTSSLSSVKILFWDGSSLFLGPQAEVVIDELDAQTGENPRVIVLTQLSGESEHQVAASLNPDSRYEVNTASGQAAAKGTEFKVRLAPDGDALVTVSEGTVAVSSQDETVLVGSGQATITSQEEGPADPVYFFTGQGQVSLAGETWIIGGQMLTAHEGTVVIGNPQVGDDVFFEGRLQADNTRMVDLVVLLKRSPANRFTLVGNVDEIGEVIWRISGQEVAVTDGITDVDEGIAFGSRVQVDGIILPGGALQAESIRLIVEGETRVPFDFTGVIQDTEGDSWMISDIEIYLTTDTVKPADLAFGETVRVVGWVLENGNWQADSIERILIEEPTTFEFAGVIESMAPDPWEVSGVTFTTADGADIEAGLIVGDRVVVKGIVQEDGTWLADEIRKLEDWTQVHIVLVGQVISKDPSWIVSGVTIPVDAETVIEGEINVGTLVRVEIQVQPDGTWKVLTIEPLKGSEWGSECRELTSVVINVSENQVQLEGWPALAIDENTEVGGELRVGSIVLVEICYGEDGNPVIVYIHIILEPGIELPDSLDGEGTGQEKVMVCHKPNSKNPHTIVIAQPAVPAHLGHGDTLGPCP